MGANSSLPKDKETKRAEYFYLRNDGDGRYLCNNEDSLGVGDLNHDEDEEKFLWKHEDLCLKSYKGKVVDIEGGSRQEGASLILWTQHGERNQCWVMEGRNIVSKLNKLAIQLASDGKKLHMKTKSKSPFQDWVVEYQRKLSLIE